MRKFVCFTVAVMLLLLSPSETYAQGQQVKPDIRNYDVFVARRPMPVTYCPVCGTPENCIRKFVGFNQLAGNTMKFPDKLFYAGDQFEKASIMLTPYMAKMNMTDNKSRTTDEEGNKPAWVGEICCYGGYCGSGKPLISDTPIVAENPITNMFKQIRFGAYLLAAFIARDSVPMTGGVYNTKRDPIEPDPQKQSDCEVKPQGAKQNDRDDKGTGKNEFASSWLLDIACGTEFCQCEDTTMYIRTDSMIQYDTDAQARTTSGTEEQYSVVAPESRATQGAQDSGGFINALARPGLMAILHEVITKLFGNITGKVADQKTENAQGTRTEDSSYYTTMALEGGTDFLNCKLFPYGTREKYGMENCTETNWLAGFINKMTSQITGNSPSQMTAEPAEQPAEATGSAFAPAP